MPQLQPDISYPLDGRPADGELREVKPGVWWLRMPLPFVLNHINLWLLDDGDGWCVVDTGISATATRAIWEQVIDSHLGGRPITRVLVTHMHPDHIGLAGWLVEKTGATFLMTRGEYMNARLLAADAPPPPPVATNFYRAAGLSAQQLDTYRARFGRYGRLLSPLPEAYRRLQDGDELVIGPHRWQIIIGRGHSPEHACLFCAELNLLVAGDQALPTISSNVSVWPTEPAADPLADWLESCRSLPERLPGDVLVLPAHGRPFLGLAARMQDLIAEHEEGLQKIRELCVRPRRGVDVFPALFRSEIGEGNLVMAAGEAMAHLNHLEFAGELQVTTDSEGVRWYQQP